MMLFDPPKYEKDDELNHRSVLIMSQLLEATDSRD